MSLIPSEKNVNRISLYVLSQHRHTVFWLCVCPTKNGPYEEDFHWNLNFDISNSLNFNSLYLQKPSDDSCYEWIISNVNLSNVSPNLIYVHFHLIFPLPLLADWSWTWFSAMWRQWWILGWMSSSYRTAFINVNMICDHNWNIHSTFIHLKHIH